MYSNLKTISHKVRGDLLEVKLLDNTLTVYFKCSAHINNKKEMKQLIDDLNEKGVSFKRGWFD